MRKTISPSCVVAPLFFITSSTCIKQQQQQENYTTPAQGGQQGTSRRACRTPQSTGVSKKPCTRGGPQVQQLQHLPQEHASSHPCSRTFFCVARSLLCVVSTSSPSSSSIWPWLASSSWMVSPTRPSRVTAASMSSSCASWCLQGGSSSGSSALAQSSSTAAANA